MSKKLKKIIHIVVDVLVIAVLLISVTTLAFALTSRANGGVPNLFGKSPIGVKTNSMHGDKPDSFDKDDLIICDKVENLDKKDFKVGDVVTFLQDISGTGEKSLVTHRIYKINEDGTFQTKGDNNDTYDQNPGNSIVFPNLQYYDILAVYHGSKIPAVGGFINMLQTSVGFFWCILFPMILFFIYQAIRVIMNAMAYSKEKGAEQARLAVESSELTEEQKARAIEEYLANQKKSEEKSEEHVETEEKAAEDISE